MPFRTKCVLLQCGQALILCCEMSLFEISCLEFSFVVKPFIKVSLSLSFRLSKSCFMMSSSVVLSSWGCVWLVCFVILLCVVFIVSVLIFKILLQL